MPSAAMTRSCEAASSATGGASALNRTSTPSSAARAWRMFSRWRLLSAEKPWPPERSTAPR